MLDQGDQQAGVLIDDLCKLVICRDLERQILLHVMDNE